MYEHTKARMAPKVARKFDALPFGIDDEVREFRTYSILTYDPEQPGSSIWTTFSIAPTTSPGTLVNVLASRGISVLWMQPLPYVEDEGLEAAYAQYLEEAES